MCLLTEWEGRTRKYLAQLQDAYGPSWFTGVRLLEGNPNYNNTATTVCGDASFKSKFIIVRKRGPIKYFTKNGFGCKNNERP